MFFAGQLRCNFLSFILDNCHLGIPKNIIRCGQVLKITMSNIQDSAHSGVVISDNRNTAQTNTGTNIGPSSSRDRADIIVISDNENRFEDAITSTSQSSNIFNASNIRRSWSAENICMSRPFTCWGSGGEPFFYYNSSQFCSPQQGEYFLTNVLEYPMVVNPYNYNMNGGYSGGFANTAPNNYFFQGGGPSHNQAPSPLLSSQSIDDMQRRYFMRRNNSEDNIPRYNAANPRVLKVLSKRYWENVRKNRDPSTPGVEFTLMSYNVLAQNLLNEHPYLYKNHNPRSLQWNKRWINLLGEISKILPDIMCLQEVQESHLTDFYSTLESMGYRGIYKKRTGIRCDGCAIYYKADKFNLVEYETVEFCQPNVDVLNRDNVAVIAKFAPIVSPHSQFIVATTHLLYNPKRQDVRLAQTQLLLTEVERLSFQCRDRDGPCYWPIIITGDFNSTPNSTVYELITKGVLRYEHLSARRLDNSKSTLQGNVLVPSILEITDKCQHAQLVHYRQKLENISRQDEVARIKLHNSDKAVTKVSSESIENPSWFCTGTLSHSFAFKSVYGHGDPDNAEGTTFQDKWLSVDYIFYSGKKRFDNVKDDKLKLISRYRLPRKSELGSMKIPNSVFGSDHLSLIAKFNLRV